MTVGDVTVFVDREPASTAVGEEASFSISVTNESSIVDMFDVSMVGLDARRWDATPGLVSLLPGESAIVEVVAEVPRDATAGPLSVGVTINSKTSGAVSGFCGVTLDVLPHAEIGLSIDPPSIIAGSTGRVGVLLHNAGNGRADVILRGRDDEHAFGFDFAPERVQLEAGGSRVAQLLVQGRRPIVGAPLPRAFVVEAIVNGTTAATTTGVCANRPWIPQLALTLGLMLATLGIWAVLVGGALDAVIDDSDTDLANAFAEGLESLNAEEPPALDSSLPGPQGSIIFDAASGSAPGFATAYRIAEPVSDPADAVLLPDAEPIRAQSGADGLVTLAGLSRGPHLVVIGAEGFEPMSCVVVVPALDGAAICDVDGSPMSIPLSGAGLSIELPAKATPVIGAATDDLGRPLANRQIDILAFRGTGGPSRDLSKRADDGGGPPGGAKDGAGDSPAGPLRGGLCGPPADGTDAPTTHWSRISTVFTDDTGSFQVEIGAQHTPGTFMMVLCGRDEHEVVASERFEITTPGEATIGPTLTAPPTDGVATGMVVNAASVNAATPIASASLLFFAPGEPAVETFTVSSGDEAGSFAVILNDATNYSVHVTADGFHPYTGPITETIELSPLSQELTVSVSNLDGSPAPAFELFACDANQAKCPADGDRPVVRHQASETTAQPIGGGLWRISVEASGCSADLVVRLEAQPDWHLGDLTVTDCADPPQD